MATLTITDVREIDDAGGIHYETRMTAGYIVDMFYGGLLALEGNIRPKDENNKGPKKASYIQSIVAGYSPKTRRKIHGWAQEILNGTMAFGNLSVRLDPMTKHLIAQDGQQQDLLIETPAGEHAVDTAVDAQSRILAALLAAETQPVLFNREQRLAVRVYICDLDKAHEIAVRYNVEGESVNASRAHSASPRTPADRLASWLLRDSKNPHLSTDNIEIMSNSVSAGSHKLCGFYTLPLALDQEWTSLPVTDGDLTKVGNFISECWFHLVTVRPEYGLTSIAVRQGYRKTSVAGAALGIYGAMSVISGCYDKGLTSVEAQPYLDKLGGEWALKTNKRWEQIGVLTSSVIEKDGESVTVLNTRNTFQSRKAVAQEFRKRAGL